MLVNFKFKKMDPKENNISTSINILSNVILLCIPKRSISLIFDSVMFKNKPINKLNNYPVKQLIIAIVL